MFGRLFAGVWREITLLLRAVGRERRLQGRKARGACGYRVGSGLHFSPGAFTLIELLVCVAVIGLLAALLLPVLSSAKSKGQAIACLNNERQLGIACQLYTDDANGTLPYNMGTSDIQQLAASGRYVNWTTPIMDWELSSDNTNTTLTTRGGIGPYTSGAAKVYRCPSDNVVSDTQASVGWSSRVRSYSMNAMVGNAGRFTYRGANVNNPGYAQFFKAVQVPRPNRIFIFIEEHPDSINDGYFLDQPETNRWHDLPASYHDRSCNLTFADGHVEQHRWLCASTTPPSKPDAANLPIPNPPGELAPTDRTDFEWLIDRMTVDSE